MILQHLVQELQELRFDVIQWSDELGQPPQCRASGFADFMQLFLGNSTCCRSAQDEVVVGNFEHRHFVEN